MLFCFRFIYTYYTKIFYSADEYMLERCTSKVNSNDELLNNEENDEEIYMEEEYLSEPNSTDNEVKNNEEDENTFEDENNETIQNVANEEDGHNASMLRQASILETF